MPRASRIALGITTRPARSTETSSAIATHYAMMPLKDLDGRIPFRRRRGRPTGRGAWSLGAREKGATVPTGQTEFQFKAGALNFKSAAYEWLGLSRFPGQQKGTG